MNYPTQEVLKELLSYDLATGIFKWKKPLSPAVSVGDAAGSMNAKGYLNIKVQGRLYKAHRIAWLYVHGVIPKFQIDHINGDKSDNRISNLRLATNSENVQNVHEFRSNATGFPGVTYYHRERKYVARVTCNGKTRSLGYYETPELAHAEYIREKRKVHSFFNL